MVVKVVLYKLKFSTTNFSLQKMEDSDHCTVTLSPSLPVADDSLNPVVRLQRLDVQRYLSSGLVLLCEMYLSLAPFTALNSNDIHSCLCRIIVDMLILYIIVGHCHHRHHRQHHRRGRIAGKGHSLRHSSLVATSNITPPQISWWHTIVSSDQGWPI